MNGRAIPRAYLFRLYVCDKEMSWPHHIGETHQPDWAVYVRDSEKWDSTLDRFLTSALAKRQRQATEEEETYLEQTLKIWKKNSKNIVYIFSV
jgi:hypothetical protein